jgi:hypothetical protein
MFLFIVLVAVLADLVSFISSPKVKAWVSRLDADIWPAPGGCGQGTPSARWSVSVLSFCCEAHPFARIANNTGPLATKGCFI